MQKASRFLLFLVNGNQHIRPQGSLHRPRNLFIRIAVFIHYPNKLQQKFPHFPQQDFLGNKQLPYHLTGLCLPLRLLPVPLKTVSGQTILTGCSALIPCCYCVKNFCPEMI